MAFYSDGGGDVDDDNNYEIFHLTNVRKYIISFFC